MEIGIIGLPNSGKTTVFNALAKGRVEVATYGSGALQPNVGVVKVPDRRLDILNDIFKPKRKVFAEVKYIDIPGGARGLGKGEGIAGPFLNYLSTIDVLMHVVRDFQDESNPHVKGSIDPKRDIEEINLELAFSDLSLIEKRLERIEVSLKGAKPQERDLILSDQALMRKIKEQLEANVPVRAQPLEPDEKKAIENYQFLTAKPMLIALNIGEESLRDPSVTEMEKDLQLRYCDAQCRVVSLCGKIEMELAELSEEEAADFRSSLGIEQSASDRVIRTSYELAGLISFFTVGQDEVRAWTLRRGTPAVKASGKIHSDIERGFIRAEVIAYDDFVKHGSIAEARKHGILRLEGKNYLVQDGDIITFLFNV